ncbi:MAG: hypothetical protein Q4D02_01850 [Clostridia bacterium]|nr:hypothetical protein [Clostridia bacterium]
MTLKEQYLSIKNIKEITPEQEIIFYNELDWKDKEILKHYQILTKDIDYEESNKTLKEELEHGFEISWLLRKEDS